MLQQRTLQTITRAVGVGLHSGQRVELTLRPAPTDTGIVFRRVDLPEPVSIPVNAEAITDTRLASTISHEGAKVHTVEHLMSACAGLGLDNLYVDITAEEVPILDGSASSFVFLLQSAGIALQDEPKRFIRVKQKVEVRDGEGATKLVTIEVRGARSTAEAERVARRIANSPLVKTAFFGCDPNVGRIVAAAGASGVVFDPDRLELAVGGVKIAARGMILTDVLDRAQAAMREREFHVCLDLRMGRGSAIILTTDLTLDYVRINAEYTT